MPNGNFCEPSESKGINELNPDLRFIEIGLVYVRVAIEMLHEFDNDSGRGHERNDSENLDA
jgi:hypothetical protein